MMGGREALLDFFHVSLATSRWFVASLPGEVKVTAAEWVRPIVT